jgi:hypothetical protein
MNRRKGKAHARLTKDKSADSEKPELSSDDNLRPRGLESRNLDISIVSTQDKKKYLGKTSNDARKAPSTNPTIGSLLRDVSKVSIHPASFKEIVHKPQVGSIKRMLLNSSMASSSSTANTLHKARPPQSASIKEQALPSPKNDKPAITLANSTIQPSLPAAKSTVPPSRATSPKALSKELGQTKMKSTNPGPRPIKIKTPTRLRFNSPKRTLENLLPIYDNVSTKPNSPSGKQTQLNSWQPSVTKNQVKEHEKSKIILSRPATSPKGSNQLPKSRSDTSLPLQKTSFSKLPAQSMNLYEASPILSRTRLAIGLTRSPPKSLAQIKVEAEEATAPVLKSMKSELDKNSNKLTAEERLTNRILDRMKESEEQHQMKRNLLDRLHTSFSGDKMKLQFRKQNDFGEIFSGRSTSGKKKKKNRVDYFKTQWATKEYIPVALKTVVD